MKPRTKLQLRVAGLSSQLPNIENMMIDWAKSRGQEKRIWFGITQYQERLEIRNDKSDNGNYDVIPVIFCKFVE